MSEFERGFSKDQKNDGKPEFRDFMATRFIRFLNRYQVDLLGGKKAEDVFRDQDSTTDFLLSLEPDTYSKLLIGI